MTRCSARAMVLISAVTMLAATGGRVAAQSSIAFAPPPDFAPTRIAAMVLAFLPPAGSREGAAGGNGVAAPNAPSSLGTPPASRGPRTAAPLDQKLYLDRQQVAALLPLFNGLVQHPYPSPAEARKLLASVNDVLRPDQRAAWASLQEALAKNLTAAPRGGAAGSGRSGRGFGGGAFGGGGNAAGGTGRAPGGGFAQRLQSMTSEQRQQFLQSLSPDQRARLSTFLGNQGGASSAESTTGAGDGSGGALTSQAPLTPYEIKQRTFELVVRRLQLYAATLA